MTISATKLRADLYRVIDDVIKKGVPVEVELRGRKVRIVPEEPRDKLVSLVKRPGVIVGDPGRLPRIKTFDEKMWRKKWNRRLE
jgi:prevent-host-death family protein